MPFQPTKKSLRRHEVPQWYQDAKLGIFITWGPYAVPAYAPTDLGDISEIIDKYGYKTYLKNNPYAEWYVNTMKIEGSPTHKYHRETYGENASYDQFATEFNESIKKWDPESWATLFQQIHARYIVLTANHMDGFLLWPSKYPNPKKANWCATRNIVGELAAAVRSKGIKLGIYHLCVMDDTWNSYVMQAASDAFPHVPAEPAFSEYIDNHYYEIIDQWKPDILWNDIGYPPYGRLYEIIAHYYNTVENGVINDRWLVFSNRLLWLMKKFRLARKLAEWAQRRAFKKGGAGNPFPVLHDYSTLEYITPSKILREKWECCRGIGRSFGYNQMETDAQCLSVPALIYLFADIVSKNGNLLLNIGPKPDGTIPQIQLNRLLGLGKWLDINGEALFDTQPWKTFGGLTTEGINIRYTQKQDALYVIVLHPLEKNNIMIDHLLVDDHATIKMLGDAAPLKTKQEGTRLTICIPAPLEDTPAICLKITPKPN
jgi:alpha-L-fucosidase